MTNTITNLVAPVTDFSSTAVGAQTAANGKLYEKYVAKTLDIRVLENKEPSKLVMVKKVLEALNIDVNNVYSTHAYRMKGTKKADIRFTVLFKDGKDKDYYISLKGSPDGGQFYNTAIENVTKHIEDEDGKKGLEYFFGLEEKVNEIHILLKSKLRNRLFKHELTKNHRNGIINGSCKLPFVNFIIEALIGPQDRKVDLIMSPMIAWSLSQSELYIVNTDALRDKILRTYEKSPHLFIENDENCIEASSERYFTPVVLNKNGKYKTPFMSSTIRFCSNLVTLKRKGSEKSKSIGFEPSNVQVFASVAELYRFVAD